MTAACAAIRPANVMIRKGAPSILLWKIRTTADKERRKALRSAIAATSDRELVMRRGHRIDGLKSFPIVVVDDIEKVSKTKDLVSFLDKIGMEKELERSSEKKVRPGKGKTRGRKYKKKRGPLFVIAKDGGICKAVRNLPGCDYCKVDNLSAEYLAPGAAAGRLVVWTKGAIDKLGK